MDRATHTSVRWAVVPHRDLATLQAVVDHAPQARTYTRDGLPGYPSLVYGLAATHTAGLDKSEPYSVAGGNADLRHYLARLVRKSRCVSRGMRALQRAVKLGGWCYNQQQLWKQRYPRYPKHLIQCVSPLC